MDFDYQGKLGKRNCRYCKAEFEPTTSKNVMCLPCQFSDARRKRYSQTNKKLKTIIDIK